MKITIITHNFIYNDGQGKVNFELVRYLSSKGYQLLLIGNGFDESIKDMPNVKIYKIPILFKKPNILKQINFTLFSDILLFFLKSDIIDVNGGITFHKHHINHIHFCHSYWVKELTKIKLKNIKWLYHYFYHSINSFWEKICFRYLGKKLVAVSEKVKYEVKNYCNIPDEKITVVHNGVDVEKFTPERRKEAREMIIKKFSLKKDDFIIFFAGDMRTNRKGFGTVINAMELLKDYEDIKLIAIGNIKDNIFIKDVIEKGLKNIFFAGFVKDNFNWYPGFDLYISPSYQCDHFSLTILEALSSGIPVITSPFYFVKPDEYLIKDGINGFNLKSPDDYKGLKDYILMIYKDRRLLRNLSINARNTALKFTWDKMGEEFEKLFKAFSPYKNHLL